MPLNKADKSKLQKLIDYKVVKLPKHRRILASIQTMKRTQRKVLLK